MTPTFVEARSDVLYQTLPLTRNICLKIVAITTFQKNGTKKRGKVYCGLDGSDIWIKCPSEAVSNEWPERIN